MTDSFVMCPEATTEDEPRSTYDREGRGSK
jgi:hypothetical protein